LSKGSFTQGDVRWCSGGHPQSDYPGQKEISIGPLVIRWMSASVNKLKVTKVDLYLQAMNLQDDISIYGHWNYITSIDLAQCFAPTPQAGLTSYS
jgi:hypothetical protein